MSLLLAAIVAAVQATVLAEDGGAAHHLTSMIRTSEDPPPSGGNMRSDPPPEDHEDRSHFSDMQSAHDDLLGRELAKAKAHEAAVRARQADAAKRKAESSMPSVQSVHDADVAHDKEKAASGNMDEIQSEHDEDIAAGDDDAVTPGHEDNDWCSRVPESTGFLLVANRPVIMSGLPDTSRCIWPGWTVVHFNDCSLGWPDKVSGVQHMLIRRWGDQAARDAGSPDGFWGKDTSCEEHGIHDAKVFRMNGESSDFQSKSFVHEHKGRGKDLSTGISTAISLRQCNPTARMVSVGFDFRANGTEISANFHDFARERSSAKRMHLFERVPAGDVLPPDLLMDCCPGCK